MRALPRHRAGFFALLVALALAAAVLGALATGEGTGIATVGVEALSSSSSRALDRLAGVLPLGFAFGAGMVSAANPCGFAMLPAFLALFLRNPGGERGGTLARVRRALSVGAVMTAGFLVLFGAVGMAIAAGARTMAAGFPWFGLAVGVLLVLAGAWTAVGGTLYAYLPGVGPRPARVAGAGAGDSFAFGLAYGVASLSCTLPVFLAVLGSTLTLSRLPDTMLQLALYGLGMGTVITLLALSVAAFQGAMVDRVRRAVPYVAPASAALLLLAGSYIVYYWLTVGGLGSAFLPA